MLEDSCVEFCWGLHVHIDQLLRLGGAAGWEPRQRKRPHPLEIDPEAEKEGVGEEGEEQVWKSTEAFMATAAGQAG